MRVSAWMAREEWQLIKWQMVFQNLVEFKDFILYLFSVVMPVRAPGANFSLPGEREAFRFLFAEISRSFSREYAVKISFLRISELLLN